MAGTTSVGTVFNRGDGASNEAFTAIANVRSIAGPSKIRATIDSTALDTAGGYRTFIAHFRDGGDVTLAMNFTRAGYDDMNDDMDSDDTVNYQIVLPDTSNTTLEFAGLVTALSLGASTDDMVSSDVTIKVSGAVTLTT